MEILGKEVSIDDAVRYADIDKVLIKRRENNILLSDYQVEVLKRANIDYKSFINMHELLFEIGEYLNEVYDDELDSISKQLAEYIYYGETKK